MEFVKKNIKYFSLGGCLLVIISLFLPFVTVSMEFLGQNISQSANFIEGDGVIVFVAVVVAGVLIFIKKEILSLVPLVISVAITLYDAINGASKFGEVSSLYSGIKLSYGVGFYLAIIGLIFAIACICYNQFGIKKITPTEFLNQLLHRNNKNVAQPTGQVIYDQSFTRPNTNSVSPSMEGVNTQPANGTSYQTPVTNNTEQPVQEYSNSTNVICPQCKAVLNSGVQFCNQCGTKIN